MKCPACGNAKMVDDKGNVIMQAADMGEGWTQLSCSLCGTGSMIKIVIESSIVIEPSEENDDG